jgi:HNH endonuclease
LPGKIRDLEHRVTKSGCHEIISHRKGMDGYVQIRVGGKKVRAHRYIYELNFGVIQNGFVIRHICDNPICINPQHLLEGTPQDNANDCVSRGRSTRGVKNGRCKLSPQEVRNILKLTGKLTLREAARRYGVSATHIMYIQKGISWKHLREV